MIVSRLWPAAGSIDLATPDSRDRLAEWYAPPSPRWTRLNLVASVTGSAAGADGTSDTLTTGADRPLLGVIRRLADVVLVGASSVRVEGYVVPTQSVLAVVTGSGDLGGHRFAADAPPGRVIVLCPASAVDRVRETVPAADILVPAGAADSDDPRMSASSIIAALHGRGLDSIVCEGGPTLAAQLIAADLVDEVCLTTSPILTGAHLPVLGRDALPERRLDLRQLMTDDSGAVYARWGVRRD